jgi:translation initiation factor 2-alpha kinase 4
MSPKNRKKAPRQKKQSSDSSTLTSPIATTNYREIHLNEVAALRSIYGDDFEDVENRPSAWQVCTKLRCPRVIIDVTDRCDLN